MEMALPLVEGGPSRGRWPSPYWGFCQGTGLTGPGRKGLEGRAGDIGLGRNTYPLMTQGPSFL